MEIEVTLENIGYLSGLGRCLRQISAVLPVFTKSDAGHIRVNVALTQQLLMQNSDYFRHKVRFFFL